MLRITRIHRDDPGRRLPRCVVLIEDGDQKVLVLSVRSFVAGFARALFTRSPARAA